MVRNWQKTMIMAAHSLFFSTSRAFEASNEREMLIAWAISPTSHPALADR
jgi:hypothetical protein